VCCRYRIVDYLSGVCMCMAHHSLQCRRCVWTRVGGSRHHCGSMPTVHAHGGRLRLIVLLCAICVTHWCLLRVFLKTMRGAHEAICSMGGRPPAVELAEKCRVELDMVGAAVALSDIVSCSPRGVWYQVRSICSKTSMHSEVATVFRQQPGRFEAYSGG
jgi:hypothetical protein